MADFEYDAIQTCAADGSLPAACPVGIDTGELIKEFRRRERGPREQALALALARRYGIVEGAAARAALTGARARARRRRRRRARDRRPPARQPRAGAVAAGQPAARGARGSRRPRAPAPPPSTCRRASTASSATRAATARPVAAAGAGRGLGARRPAAVDTRRRRRPLLRARRGARRATGAATTDMARRTAAALWRWSEGGRLPVVIDASSCALGLREDLATRLPTTSASASIDQVLDSIDWVHDRLLPELRRAPPGALGRAAPDLLGRSGWACAGKLAPIAAALADEVRVPAAAAAAAWPATAGSCIPSCPASALRDAGRRPRRAPGRRAPVQQPHLRDRACRRSPGSPTPRSCCCSSA